MSKRSERLFEALSEIDDKKIDSAAPAEKTKKGQFHWKRWAALAAALAVVIGVGSYVVPRIGGNAGTPGNSADSQGSSGASTFMSYAGPVFPLTLWEADGGITAEREITLDFAPWVPYWWSNEEEADREGYTPEQRQQTLDLYNEWYPEGGRWRSSSDILVADAYTLTNTSTEDKTVLVRYPFAGKLQSVEMQRPVLTADGERLETTLYAGGYSGGFAGAGDPEDEGRWNLWPLNGWEGYRDLLADGGYQQGAFGDYPDLSDVTAIVYEFTDSWGVGGEAPSIQAGFNLDYTRTMVLSFGFNGGRYDYDEGWEGNDYFIPQPGQPDHGKPRYLIILGDDVQNMTVQGYRNGGCQPGQEIEAIVNVRRYEISLEDILREVAQEMYAWWDEPGMGEFEMYFGLMKDDLLSYGILADYPAERYHLGHLEGLDFEHMDRVFYLEAQVTIPAGGSVALMAEMTKEPSYDFHCAHTENQGVCGYDMVTELGSNLVCTVQTAVLEDRGQIEIIRQNFGFDLENGVNRVTLDPEAEHYYLEVRSRADRFEQ